MRQKIYAGWVLVLFLFLCVPHVSWGAETTKWFELGVQAKNDDEKIKYFTKVIEIDPNHVAAYNNRGNAYSRKNKPLRAMADFSRAVELDPKDWQAYYNRGLSYKDEGVLEHALQDFTQVIKLKPDFAGGYRNRGISYALKGETQKAISDLSRSVRLFPKKFHYIAYNRRALIYKGLKQYAQAHKDYEISLRFKPNYAAAMNNFAWMLATVRDAHYRNGMRAAMVAEQAVRLSPSAQYTDTLAAAYAEAGRFDDAIRTQKEAIAKLEKEKPQPARMAGYKQRLESYNNHRPWRAD